VDGEEDDGPRRPDWAHRHLAPLPYRLRLAIVVALVVILVLLPFLLLIIFK
jgi:hypothetical protein